MKATKFILAIDLGTSGPKVVLISTEGDIVAQTYAHTELILLPGGGAEQDPKDWWRAIKACVHELLAQKLVPVDEIVAISCTGQWSGTVAVGQDGLPLTNAIIWLDARGEPYARQITDGLINIAGYGLDKLLTWIRLTGGIPTLSGKDSIAHILYLKHQHPDIYAQTHKFLEPKDYLNFWLTGRYVATYDSITLHWLTDNRDLAKVDYSARLLQMATIEREKLPDLIRAVDVVGTLRPSVAAELGLNASVQVIGSSPDMHTAAVGSGAVGDYEAHIYLGTSSWLICHVPFKKTDLFHNMGSMPSAIPDRYLLVNEQESAGSCINYLIDNLLYPADGLGAVERPVDVYDRLNVVAAAVPAGSDNLIFLPWLYGERSPIDDSTVRGGFFNQSLQTTRAHMVRAVFEGVAYNTRWLLQYVEKFIKRPLQSIRVIGGGAQSDLWCQIMADVLDRPMLQIDNPLQVNTRGAAFIAAVALGYLSFADVNSRVKVTQTYHPNPENRQIYDKLFREFDNLYKNNRGSFARLNG
ncbi:MAG: FGGY-family carbohydrate kinase [Anaerolineales bacterium]|nr:FGGY-family carbohydrate kinase [Anaerolineales bacterium]